MLEKFSRVRIKFDDGEIIEWEHGVYDENSMYSIFHVGDCIFSAMKSRIVWISFVK